VLIERSIEIARSPEEVFSFVGNPLNDPLWCPKVKSVEPVGDPQAAGPGARFVVVHRPIPLRPARRMDYVLVAWDPPHRVEWREDDGHDRIDVTYALEPTDDGTLLTQRDEAELGAPRFLWPLMRAGIGADISRQLKRLRRQLGRD
jgi:uncharacterized protein YndB with AHSA1/START domain